MVDDIEIVLQCLIKRHHVGGEVNEKNAAYNRTGYPAIGQSQVLPLLAVASAMRDASELDETSAILRIAPDPWHR